MLIDINSLDNLKKQVQIAIRRELLSSKDFQFLALQINEKTQDAISVSTLKRMWGVIDSEHQPSANTLDILSRFVGYSNYADFISKKDNRRKVTSFSYSSKIILTEDLAVGTRLAVSWKPDRYCVFKYLGNKRFEILVSMNSKLKEHATFRCDMFAERLCAVITDYCSETAQHLTFVIGYNGGLSSINTEN